MRYHADLVTEGPAQWLSPSLPACRPSLSLGELIITGSGFGLHVPETPPLVVEEGGFAFPLCPSGWHRLEPVDAFLEVGVDHLLKPINKAYVAKSRDGSVDFKLLDQFLY